MLTNSQIIFLNRVCSSTRHWTETNNIINVNGNVNMEYMNLTQIPVQFGQVTGDFICSNNKLINLKGCPSIVNGQFNCEHNGLSTLENGPMQVQEYACGANILTNLIGAPEICHTTFFCDINKLTSLEGCPRIIKGNLYCGNNPYLNILYGIGRVNGFIKTDIIINDLNKWIVMQARQDIFLSYDDIINWINQNAEYEFIIHIPTEMKRYISPYLQMAVDFNLFKERLDCIRHQ